MYIGRNSIFCLKAFLDGWHFRNPKQTDNSEILIEFTDWIQAKFNIDRYSVSWDKLDLLRKYSSHRINQSCNQIYP